MPNGTRPRIAYVLTRPLPRKDTDTEQVIRTVEALSRAGAAVDLILPTSVRDVLRGRARWERAIRDFYRTEGDFSLRPVYTVEPSPIEAERPTHALASVLMTAGRYDLVHTRSKSTLTLCVALGRPVVFETYRRLGHDSPRWAATLARMARTRAFLGLVTHSRQSADSLLGAGIPAAKIAVVHNGYDPRQLAPRLDKGAARAAVGLPADARIVCYTGNVQRAKGLGTVLDMAARTPDVRYVIVGGKAHDLAALKTEVTGRGLTNVDLPGWVPAVELGPWLLAADVLIIPPAAGPLQASGKTVLPMKVFAYLAAGRPILAGDLPDVGEVLRDGDNARLVPPDDTDAAVAALNGILGDDRLAERLAAGALRSSAGLSWDARAARILRHYADWRLMAGA